MRSPWPRCSWSTTERAPPKVKDDLPRRGGATGVVAGAAAWLARLFRRSRKLVRLHGLRGHSGVGRSGPHFATAPRERLANERQRVSVQGVRGRSPRKKNDDKNHFERQRQSAGQAGGGGAAL